MLSFKKVEKLASVLTINILFSIILLLQFVELFFGRWFDFISFGMNIVFVISGWMIYADGWSQRNRINVNGYKCLRAWALCKVILQGIVIFELLIGSIVLIVGGSRYGFVIYIILGVFALLFGITFRVFYMIFFIKMYRFTGKVIFAIENNQVIYIKNYKAWLILIAVFEGVKLLTAIIGGIMLQSNYYFDYLYYFDLGYFSEDFIDVYLKMIAHSFSIGSIVMEVMISGIGIAIAVLGVVVVKKIILNYSIHY